MLVWCAAADNETCPVEDLGSMTPSKNASAPTGPPDLMNPGGGFMMGNPLSSLAATSEPALTQDSQETFRPSPQPPSPTPAGEIHALSIESSGPTPGTLPEEGLDSTEEGETKMAELQMGSGGGSNLSPPDFPPTLAPQPLAPSPSEADAERARPFISDPSPAARTVPQVVSQQSPGSSSRIQTTGESLGMTPHPVSRTPGTNAAVPLPGASVRMMPAMAPAAHKGTAPKPLDPPVYSAEKATEAQGKNTTGGRRRTLMASALGAPFVTDALRTATAPGTPAAEYPPPRSALNHPPAPGPLMGTRHGTSWIAEAGWDSSKGTRPEWIAVLPWEPPAPVEGALGDVGGGLTELRILERSFDMEGIGRRLKQNTVVLNRTGGASPPPPRQVCSYGDPFRKASTSSCCRVCAMADRKYNYYRDSDLDPSENPPLLNCYSLIYTDCSNVCFAH